MKEGRLQWYPAFVDALHIEIEDEPDVLEIQALAKSYEPKRKNPYCQALMELTSYLLQSEDMKPALF